MTKTPKRLLVDSRAISFQLLEGSDSGKVKVRGEFARWDKPTANGRLYPKAVWESEIRRLRSDLKSRRVLGEPEHPADGRTQVYRVSHVVTDLRVEEDGSVVGEAELLDTARGKDLKAIITSGCTLGVSSRGYGSTETTEGGQERVSSDYRLETFDFVCNPADVTAYPEQIESVDAPEERPVVLAESSNKFAEALAVETARVASELRAEFTEKLPVLLAMVKAEALAEAEENFRSGTTDYSNAVSQIKDLLSDAVQAVPSAPNQDASVSELSLKIEELCGEVDRLRDERDRALTLARTTGHKYFLEKKLSGDSDAEFIRNALGDVGRYENLASLGDRLDAIQAQLAERRAQQAEEARQKEAAERLKIEEIESRVRAEREKNQAKIETVQRLAESQQAREAELTSVVSQLEEALAKSIEATRIQGLVIYAERKIASHPRANEMRKMLESASFNSKEEVDELIESLRETVSVAPRNEDVEVLRAKVRRLTRGGLSSTPEQEEKRPTASLRESSELDDLLGCSLEGFRKLAGQA